jgi:hypothetical protein
MTSPAFYAPQDRPIRKICGGCMTNYALPGKGQCETCLRNLEDFLAEGDERTEDSIYDHGHGHVA